MVVCQAHKSAKHISKRAGLPASRPGVQRVQCQYTEHCLWGPATVADDTCPMAWCCYMLTPTHPVRQKAHPVWAWHGMACGHREQDCCSCTQAAHAQNPSLVLQGTEHIQPLRCSIGCKQKLMGSTTEGQALSWAFGSKQIRLPVSPVDVRTQDCHLCHHLLPTHSNRELQTPTAAVLSWASSASRHAHLAHIIWCTIIQQTAATVPGQAAAGTAYTSCTVQYRCRRHSNYKHRRSLQQQLTNGNST